MRLFLSVKRSTCVTERRKTVQKKIVCIDMDGTLAEWEDYYISIKEMTAPGFYERLIPIKNVVEAVKLLHKYDDIEVRILSTVLTPLSIEEKNRWLDKYLPEITADRRYFTRSYMNEVKTAIFDGHIPSDFTLLDDYTKNLRHWKEAGGIGICLLNGDNAPSGKWTGNYVYYRSDPECLAFIIHAIATGKSL